MDAKQLAKLADVPTREVNAYIKRGLLDPDEDGVLDEFDVLRLRLLRHYAGLGLGIEEIEEAISSGSKDVLYSELLWGEEQDQVSAEAAAEQVGIPLDAVNVLLRSIGFGSSIPRRDLRFLEAVKGLVEEGLPLKMILDIARVYGDTLRRLAASEVRMIREFHLSSGPDGGRSSLLKSREQSERMRTVQELVGPILEPLLLAVHRRHLLRASVQEALADLEAAGRGAERDVHEVTIAFVDLASFMSLSQVHGDEVAAEILDRFDELVRGLLEPHKGNLVKQIGDAFMLVFNQPRDAIAFAVDLDSRVASTANFPAVRTGIHAGPVLYRVGDYVGNTVNVAARIAALAGANEILVADELADVAREVCEELEGFQVSSAGERPVPGLEEPLHLIRISREGHVAERDPVCGMPVGGEAVATLRHTEHTYSFCSPACLRRFLADPVKYASKYEDAEREAKPEL